MGALAKRAVKANQSKKCFLKKKMGGWGLSSGEALGYVDVKKELVIPDAKSGFLSQGVTGPGNKDIPEIVVAD